MELRRQTQLLLNLREQNTVLIQVFDDCKALITVWEVLWRQESL